MSKTVLITGGGRGIGAAIARMLATQGHALILTYNTDVESAMKSAAVCRSLGASHVEVKALNTSDVHSIETFGACLQSAGGCDVLINNAGSLDADPFSSASVESLMRMCRVNFEGPILLSRIVLPYVRDGIVNIGSICATEGQPRLGVYSATKAGLRMFSQMLGEHLKEERPNFWVYAIHPDETSTDMSLHHGRSPDDVAGLVSRIVSGKLRPPTGSNIGMDAL